MSLHSKRTSLITILSSEHGRMRREQRDIDKRDLQSALRYGTKQKTWGDRWKVEHDGIIFITDSLMRREITAYPSPLALAPITADMSTEHQKASIVIQRKPELCASHTVLVVDNSGSMATHDIILYRDRQTAAYTVTALEFVAEQLINRSANNSDIVSLVEFNETARVVFSREPVSWVLYNKLLSRRDERNFNARQDAIRRDGVWYGDSNYLPALDEAEKLLDNSEHETCALSVLFLSDGSPTDAMALGITPTALRARLCQRMETLGEKFGERLNVTMIGFGGALHEFSYLRDMVAAINNATGNAKANFEYSDKMVGAMSTAVSSLVTSISATRASLSNIGPGRNRTKRAVQSEQQSQGHFRIYIITGHYVFDPSSRRFAKYSGLPYGALRSEDQQAAILRRQNPPPYLALRSSHCGEGAERVAFRCTLSDSSSIVDARFGQMVAKETNLVERIEENVNFHEGFCETQSLAAFLADEFNRRLRSLPDFDERTTPRLEFLKCSVLTLYDEEWPFGERGVLVEKLLDTKKFPWQKWNDNAGGVDGKAAHVPIDVDYELAKMNNVGLGVIAEGDSDDEESLSDDEELDGSAFGMHGARHESNFFTSALCRSGFFASESEYLQAFTHFTHWYTNRKAMVCDLQGVFNTDTVPPTFELSDPAIHYASKRGRERVYGRTDRGRRGMKLFFQTHKCSRGCEMLRLAGGKNKRWRKDWHERWLASFLSGR